MNDQLKKVVFENLDNCTVNGYPHDWELTNFEVVQEMIEHGALDDDVMIIDAIHYVLQWRHQARAKGEADG